MSDADDSTCSDNEQVDISIDISVEMETTTNDDSQHSRVETLKQTSTSSNEDHYVQYAKYTKLILTILFISVGIVMLIIDLNVYKTIFMLSSIFIFFKVMTFFIIITSATSLYHIQIDIIGIYGYRLYSVPSNVIQEYNTTIKSVSHLAALPGSITQQIMLVGTSMGYTLVLIAILSKETEWKQDEDKHGDNYKLWYQWISLYLEFIGNSGLFILGLWTLEKDSKLNTFLHYFGASCILLLTPTAFVLYQKFSIFSILLACLQFVAVTIWVILDIKLPNKHDNRDMVNRISYYCILSELMAILIAGIITCCFLFCMDGDIILFQ